MFGREGNESYCFQLTRKLLAPATLCGHVKGIGPSPMWPEKQGTAGQEEKMLSNTAPEGKPGQLFGPGDKPSRLF